MPESDPDEPLIEGIEVMGLLGRGETSRVYIANQERFARPVAVKVLDRGRVSAGVTELLRDEARFLAVLSAHPNILTLYDAGVTDSGLTYLVTEFLPAGSYGQRVRSEGPLDWAEVVRIGVQLAGALETSHLHGVVHGDVKPDNVLIGRVDQPLLGDFGVAVLLTRSAVAEQALLTPLHAAPELFRGAPSSVPVDIYALGSTLRTLLTGVSPAGSHTDSPAVIVARVERGELLELHAPDAPVALVELLERLTASDPADRPQSAAPVGAELQELQRLEAGTSTEMYVMSELPVSEEVPGALEPSPASPAEVTASPPAAARRSDDAPPSEDVSPSDEVTGSDEVSLPGGTERSDPVQPYPEQLEQRSRTPGVLKGSVAAVGAVLTVVAVGLLAWAQSREDTAADDRADTVAQERVAEDTATRGTVSGKEGSGKEGSGEEGSGEGPVTPSGVPRSSVAGIQPGVDFDGGDLEDTSEALESKLTEEPVIFGQLPVPPVPRPHYGQVLHTLPATFHYQAYNSGSDFTCRGLMSREMTVVGLWERTSLWPGGVLLVAVAETEDVETAHELATVLSLDIGVEAAECRGIVGYNVSDYSDYGAEHRDVDDLLLDDARHSVWRDRDLTVGSRTWPHSTRMVMEAEQYVVDISLVTDTLLAADNDQVVGNIAHQIRSRLLTSE